MGALTKSTVEEAALSCFRELSYAIGPAQLDDEGNLHVCIDGVQFCSEEKYTILEMGWAVYLAEDKVPDDWMRARGETRPSEEGWNDLASKGSTLITSHPILVALAIRAWWHRNGQPIPTAPEVEVPTFAEAVAQVRSRKIVNDFNAKHTGTVPGLKRWQPANA
jgi:hypothetical protein